MYKPLLLIGAGLVFSACAAQAPISPAEQPESTPPPIEAVKSRTINLLEQNNSGQSGTAVLEETDGRLQVTLTIVGNKSDVSQPAHIHVGNCPTPGAVKYPLMNVTDGSSFTILDLTMADLAEMGDLAINVHKSAAEAGIYTSCGDLK